jgi:hypothetical protein
MREPEGDRFRGLMPMAARSRHMPVIAYRVSVIGAGLRLVRRTCGGFDLHLAGGRLELKLSALTRKQRYNRHFG